MCLVRHASMSGVVLTADDRPLAIALCCECESIVEVSPPPSVVLALMEDHTPSVSDEAWAYLAHPANG